MRGYLMEGGDRSMICQVDPVTPHVCSFSTHSLGSGERGRNFDIPRNAKHRYLTFL
jgi:hypothetical protein